MGRTKNKHTDRKQAERQIEAPPPPPAVREHGPEFDKPNIDVTGESQNPEYIKRLEAERLRHLEAIGPPSRDWGTPRGAYHYGVQPDDRVIDNNTTVDEIANRAGVVGLGGPAGRLGGEIPDENDLAGSVIAPPRGAPQR